MLLPNKGACYLQVYIEIPVQYITQAMDKRQKKDRRGGLWRNTPSPPAEAPKWTPSSRRQRSRPQSAEDVRLVRMAWQSMFPAARHSCCGSGYGKGWKNKFRRLTSLCWVREVVKACIPDSQNLVLRWECSISNHFSSRSNRFAQRSIPTANDSASGFSSWVGGRLAG